MISAKSFALQCLVAADRLRWVGRDEPVKERVPEIHLKPLTDAAQRFGDALRLVVERAWSRLGLGLGLLRVEERLLAFTVDAPRLDRVEPVVEQCRKSLSTQRVTHT